MSDEPRAATRLSEGSARSAFRVPRWRVVAVARRPVEAYLVLLGLALALPAGGIALSRHFDGLYGQDAYAYFQYATDSVRNSILHLRPLEAFFWPPGYPLLVAVASLVTGITPLAGQIVSLVMGALVPVFTALLAQQLFAGEASAPQPTAKSPSGEPFPGQASIGQPPAKPLSGRDFFRPERVRGSGLNFAVLSGALVALCGQLWQSSIVVMADTAGLALATFSAWAVVRYAHGQQPAWLVAASAALAYATLNRWIYGLVGLPFAAYALWALSRVTQPSRAVLHALAALAIAAALLLPVFGPPLLALMSNPAEPAPFAGNLQVYSWSPLNALRREFETIDGHLSYSLPNGVYYAIAPGNLAFFGPMLAPLAAAGLWSAVREWRRPALVLIVGWAAVVYAFHAGAPWQNFRFTLAYLPPLAILVACGLAWVWRRVDRRLGPVAAAWVALGLLVQAGGGVRLVQGFIDRKDDELALVRWVDVQTEPDARLLTFGPTLAFHQYSRRPTFDLFEVGSAEISALLVDRAPTYVMVEEASLEQQWHGQRPETNVARLRADPGLRPVGMHASYTLFRVGQP